MKPCKRHGIEPIYRSKGGRLLCRTCKAQYDIRYNLGHKKEKSAWDARYYLKHRERRLAYQNKYNPEHRKERAARDDMCREELNACARTRARALRAGLPTARKQAIEMGCLEEYLTHTW